MALIVGKELIESNHQYQWLSTLFSQLNDRREMSLCVQQFVPVCLNVFVSSFELITDLNYPLYDRRCLVINMLFTVCKPPSPTPKSSKGDKQYKDYKWKTKFQLAKLRRHPIISLCAMLLAFMFCQCLMSLFLMKTIESKCIDQRLLCITEEC